MTGFNEENFLKQGIRAALDNNKVRGIRDISTGHKDLVVEEGIRRWNSGGINGREAIDHAISFAASNYKKKR